MKLSESTLETLKNFSVIRTNIVIRKGDMQRTSSEMDFLVCTVRLDQEFPEEFGIYDLSQFLNAYNALNDPRLTFEEGAVILTGNNGTVLKYYTSPVNLIKSIPVDKKLEVLPDYSFKLTKDKYIEIISMARAIAADTVTFDIVDGWIVAQVLSVIRGEFTVKIEEMEEGDSWPPNAEASINFENIKLIPDDYEVKIKTAGISQWTNFENTRTYQVVLSVGKGT